MKISARIQSSYNEHHITLDTNGNAQALAIAPKSNGFGSSVNGGELLFLALATCYCNDLYREAAKRGIRVEGVEVEVEGEFGVEGERAKNVTYRAKVIAAASEEAVRDLMQHADTVAEIQNTLRAGISVTLNEVEVVSV